MDEPKAKSDPTSPMLQQAMEDALESVERLEDAARPDNDVAPEAESTDDCETSAEVNNNGEPSRRTENLVDVAKIMAQAAPQEAGVDDGGYPELPDLDEDDQQWVAEEHDAADDDAGNEQPEQPSNLNDVPATDDSARALEAHEKEIAGLRDQLTRMAADFDNFRKRTKRQQGDSARFAREKLLLKFLPVLDNLERALNHGQDDDSSPVVKGVCMVAKQFVDVLAQEEVRTLASKGEPFDPDLHEAMSQVRTNDQPPDTVFEELEKGYTIGDRLLRPAKVVVATPSPEEVTDTTAAPDDEHSENNNMKGVVLICDDSDLVRRTVRLTLEETGYEVLDAAKAGASFQIIVTKKPSLVLMDVDMPDIAGDEATKMIKSDRKAAFATVVLFSDRPVDELQELAASCGADGYIQKTDDSAALIREVSSWIDRSRSSTPLAAPTPAPEDQAVSGSDGQAVSESEESGKQPDLNEIVDDV